jgi:hypothetical protein
MFITCKDARPSLEYAFSVWSPHQACYSEKNKRVQQFCKICISYAPLLTLHRDLLGLESLEDRRTVISAHLIRDLLCDKTDSLRLS